MPLLNFYFLSCIPFSAAMQSESASFAWQLLKDLNPDSFSIQNICQIQDNMEVDRVALI